MKKPIFIISFLGVVVVALLIARIAMVNSISTTGITLVNIQNQIAEYKRQNELLKVAYLQSASYNTIGKEAKKLGYVPVTSEIDLSAPQPLAFAK
ncbi:MAG TPA: hypothetical protein VLF93_06665 [Candidatus Saccharimonadales bacterium]|nr:hypothetical protein [Candidatus Saccharimonadales bacterium]